MTFNTNRIYRLAKRLNTLLISSKEQRSYLRGQNDPILLSAKSPMDIFLVFREFSKSATHHTVYTSQIPNLNLKEESLADYFFHKFEKFRQREALIDNDTGKKYTYLEMRDAIIKVGSALYKLGYRKGDVICICSTNNTEYAILLFACVTSGIIFTGTNPSYTSDEVARHLCHSGASGVVVVDALLPTVTKAVENHSNLCRSIKNIIVIGSSGGYRSFSSLLEDDGRSFPDNVPINPKNDVALLPYSSGTTGLPKGVMLTHMNLVSNLQQLRALFKVTPNDVSLGLLPMYHVFGMIAILMGNIQDGGRVITMPRFQPESFLTAVEQYKVTNLHIVPPMALFLAKNSLVANYNLSSVEDFFCGAAPLGDSLTKEFENRLGKRPLQVYGMTELSPVATIDMFPYNIGTVGVLAPNTSAKIVSHETGKELGPTENGEVCIKGPQVMKGYLNNEDATNDIIRDGWIHTGDIGHVREDGRFVITGRIKEIIKYKGFQVAPAELENLLLKHPAILDVAVIGVPDEEAGELPRAYVVPKSNMKVTPDEVAKFVEVHAAQHKKLRGGVEFIKEIPKSPSGKILRRTLQSMI